MWCTSSIEFAKYWFLPCYNFIMNGPILIIFGMKTGIDNKNKLFKCLQNIKNCGRWRCVRLWSWAWHPAEANMRWAESQRICMLSPNIPAFIVSEISAYIRTDGHILIKNIYTRILWGRKRFILSFTYFPTNLVYTFILRVKGIARENDISHITHKRQLSFIPLGCLLDFTSTQYNVKPKQRLWNFVSSQFSVWIYNYLLFMVITF